MTLFTYKLLLKSGAIHQTYETRIPPLGCVFNVKVFPKFGRIESERRTTLQEVFMRRKSKSIWCFLDGKKHCDVIQWALAANVDKEEAQRRLTAQSPDMKVTFKVL